MKTFLKPSPLKIILAIALLTAASYLRWLYITLTLSDTFPLGFPLQFHLAWGPCQPGASCSESNMLYLILDVLFWYVVSAFVISVFTKTKEENHAKSI